MLRDPAGRAEMDRLAQTTEGQLRAIGNWGAYVLLETFDDEYRRFEGRVIGDIAAELGKSPWDTLADIVVADELRTVIASQDRGQDDASWTAPGRGVAGRAGPRRRVGRRRPPRHDRLVLVLDHTARPHSNT